MKYARIIQKYRYNLNTWDKTGNLGDCIQNLAVENLYREMEIENIVKINRDEIKEYNGEKVLLPMQGWFGNVHDIFPINWSKDIIPVFVGFHLNDYKNCRERFIKEKIYERMQEFEPIGCRDRNTAKFLKTLGLKTYFSGCMTLTFPTRKIEPKEGKIFIVDVKDEVLKIIPDKIKSVADNSITHMYKFKNYPISEQEALEFENSARKLLEKYRTEAKLVITSRIHCAMPCLAMGIPVVFIHNNTNDTRFDVLRGLIPIYSVENKALINWSPKPVKFEYLKNAIRRNALYHIWYNAYDYCNCSKKPQNQMLQLKFLTNFYNFKGLFTNGLLKLNSKFVTRQQEKKILKLIKNKRIVFWGASLFLKDFLNRHKIKNSNIIGIIDKDEKLHNTKIGAYTIYPPEKLSEINPDIVICSIKNNHGVIYPKIKEFLKINYPKIELMPDIFQIQI